MLITSLNELECEIEGTKKYNARKPADLDNGRKYAQALQSGFQKFESDNRAKFKQFFPVYPKQSYTLISKLGVGMITELGGKGRWLTRLFNGSPEQLKVNSIHKTAKTRIIQILVAQMLYSVDEFMACHWEIDELSRPQGRGGL